MDGVEEFDRSLRLVRLQMSDQMPFNIAFVAEAPEFGNLGSGLLDTAFSERSNPGFNRFANAGRGDGLADGDKRDFGSLATGAFARRRYTLIDQFQPRPQTVQLS